MPFLRWLRTLGRVVVGGSPLGALGVGLGGLGLLAFFPFGTAIFALFRPKSQVFLANYAGLSGELPATKRRRLRRPFVTKFAVSSPFGAGAFPSSYTRVGAGAPHFAASPRETPPTQTPPLRRAKVPRPPQLLRFAARKSRLTTRLLRFALVKFAASPRKSPPAHPVFRFAVAKSTSPPGFLLRHAAASPWRRARGPPISRLPWRRPPSPLV